MCKALLIKSISLVQNSIEFDILAFSETWLHPSIQIKPPERKNRAMDHHGGVMIYVKDNLHLKRKDDLEPV